MSQDERNGPPPELLVDPRDLLAEHRVAIMGPLLVGLAHANRLISFWEFIFLNQKEVESRSEAASDRNLRALVAWGLAELHELGRSLDALERAGIADHLDADGLAAWTELLELRRSWSKVLGFLRNKFGSHIDQDLVLSGLKKIAAAGEPVAMTKTPSSRRIDLHFFLADEALAHGTLGNEGVLGMDTLAVLERIKEPQMMVPVLLERVLADLMVLDEE